MRLVHLATWVAVVALVSCQSLADEGRIPIPFASPVAFPIVITEPGSYVLTRNLEGPAPVIRIQVGLGSSVDLDLNGHTVTGTGGSISVIDNVAGVDALRIRNGHIRGDVTYGIQSSATLLTLEDLSIQGVQNGVFNNGSFQFVARRNDIDVQGTGIDVESGGSDPDRAVIQDNTIAGGILVAFYRAVDISRNQLHRGGVHVEGGFFNIGGVIQDNVLAGADSGIGIRVEPLVGGLTVRNNTISRMSTGVRVSGLNLANHLYLVGNTVTECTGDGFHIDNGTGIKLERNLANGNGTSGAGWGFHFGAAAAGNLVTGNMASGNAGGACAFPTVGGGTDYCDDAGAPGTVNVSAGDNFVPPASGAF